MGTEQKQVVQLWFNGACPSNADDGDLAGYGIVFGSANDDPDQLQTDYGRIDQGSDVTAPMTQYIALIRGLQAVDEKYGDQRPLRVEVYGDAESLIRQVDGNYTVNEAHLLEPRREALTLLDQFEEWTLDYVRENESTELEEADTLAEEGAQLDIGSKEENDG